MSENPTGRPPVEAEHKQRSSADSPMRVLSYLLAGLLFYGGLGFLADHLLGTSWITPIGMIIGFALSVYMIWKRYGGVA